MNEEYEKTVEEFLESTTKIFCDWPEMQILKEKPEMEFDFSKPKKKKTIKIIEDKKDGRRKSNTSKLF